MRKCAASVREIPRGDWDKLANLPGEEFNPLVSHDFFRALEQSGSATARTGWAGRHIVETEGSRIVGIAPGFLKSHSQGEY
ncbi:MAG TPA: peptidogalycan biosysnthesis protein, partial [Aestuariivirga sp.]|nr:peptidogalycan biosysnthesis protein [Aestuariivirga sp.]